MDYRALNQETIVAKIAELKLEHWDVDKQCWVNFKIVGESAQDKPSDKSSDCSPEESQAFARQMRLLKFRQKRIIQAKIFLDDVRKAPSMNALEVKRALTALNSREDHEALWPLINKTEPDGILFTVGHADPIIGWFCDCTDEEIVALISDMGSFATKEDRLSFIDTIRQQHNEAIQQFVNDGDGDEMICAHAIEGITGHHRQNTHVIGDVLCQACVKMPAFLDNEDHGMLADITHSPIPACPNFLSVFRPLPMDSYASVTSMKDADKIASSCYAGLVHTEMKIETIDGESKLVFTHACDTCSYTRVEIKPYQAPEPIADGEELSA